MAEVILYVEIGDSDTGRHCLCLIKKLIENLLPTAKSYIEEFGTCVISQIVKVGLHFISESYMLP